MNDKQTDEFADKAIKEGLNLYQKATTIFHRKNLTAVTVAIAYLLTDMELCHRGRRKKIYELSKRFEQNYKQKQNESKS